jgi:hypothetical protein
MANPEPVLKDKYETDWTHRGNRLSVMHFEGHAILSCESEVMNLGKGERLVFVLGRVVILDFQVRSDTERFVGHCFSFYGDDELTAHAVAAVRKIAQSLKQPSPVAASSPPRGGPAN